MRFYYAAVILLVTACSSNKPLTTESPQTTAIGNQRLVSNFTRKGIKLEWECGYLTSQSNCSKGDFSAIEVTSYAPSNGNSDFNREDAFKVAELRAKAKLRKFIQEDVSTSEVTTTLTKNIEKANDKIKSKIGETSDAVAITDIEAEKDTNVAVRENSNDITRTVIETIRVQASGILKGVYVLDEKIVDRQTVQVTIRWDKKSEKASDYLNEKFR